MNNRDDIIKEMTFDNFESFSNEVLFNGFTAKYLSNGFIFRGESSLNYKLIPSALREENKEKIYQQSLIEANFFNPTDIENIQITCEYSLLKLFFRYCDENSLKIPNVERIRNSDIFGFEMSFFNKEENWLPDDLYELAALSQHYGIPTRLLDWTKDIFVALYFATTGVLKKTTIDNDDSFIIWALNVNLIEILKGAKQPIPIRIIQPEYYGNPNLGAQQGVLTFWEIKRPMGEDRDVVRTNRTPLDELIRESIKHHDFNLKDVFFYKFIIKNYAAEDVFRFLTRMRYDAARLFPGYYGVTKKIEDNTYVK